MKKLRSYVVSLIPENRDAFGLTVDSFDEMFGTYMDVDGFSEAQLAVIKLERGYENIMERFEKIDDVMHQSQNQEYTGENTSSLVHFILFIKKMNLNPSK